MNELVEFVGLQDVAKQRAGQFSLGMGQRLGIASALLGDPATLILDEPINGLDPDGIHWMRGLLKTLAAEGRTVFLSSHLMSEMALTADHLIIIGRGRLIRDISIDEFVRESSKNVVRVRSPQADQLRAFGRLATHATIASEKPGMLDVEGLTCRADRAHRGAARHRPLRAHPPDRIARGRLHGTHPRRGGIPQHVNQRRRRRRRRSSSMSSVSIAPMTLPRTPSGGRVTQTESHPLGVDQVSFAAVHALHAPGDRRPHGGTGTGGGHTRRLAVGHDDRRQQGDFSTAERRASSAPTSA